MDSDRMRLHGSKAFLAARAPPTRVSVHRKSASQVPSPRFVTAVPKVQVTPAKARLCLHSDIDRATPELSSMMSSRVVQEYLQSLPQKQKAFPDVNRLMRKPNAQHCRSQHYRADFQKKMRWLCSLKSQSFDRASFSAPRRHRPQTRFAYSPAKPDTCDGVFNDREMKKKIKVMR